MDNKKIAKSHYESPYENSMFENWSMYDNMPYVWDRNITMDKQLKNISGNIIKSYRCIIKEPYEIKHE